MQGPLALATGGVDLSWLGGIGVAGGAYLLLKRVATSPVREEADH